MTDAPLAHIVAGLLGMAIAGCLIWLMLVQAGESRCPGFWVAQKAALVALTAAVLVLATSVFLGGFAIAA